MKKTIYARPESEILDFGIFGGLCLTSPSSIDSLQGEDPVDSGNTITF